MCLFLTVPWLGLQCVIVVSITGDVRLLFKSILRVCWDFSQRKTRQNKLKSVSVKKLIIFFSLISSGLLCGGGVIGVAFLSQFLGQTVLQVRIHTSN